MSLSSLLVTSLPNPIISRATIVRGILAVVFAVLAALAGFVFDIWLLALGAFVAAVFVAPNSWINADGGSWSGAGPT